ncbi:MAG: ATP-binding cassette domain-containing protein, partial [Dokdonella sp.]|nr:ATP-binding cassette domain-containing protein [Dokdonella sp.]
MSAPCSPDQRLARIGWRGTDDVAVAGRGSVARVVAQHRSGYELHDGASTFNAQPAARFLRRNLDPVLRPAVGDFVSVAPGQPPTIDEVLPRRSVLRRGAAGESHQQQLIATNIDLVLVLVGLDGDFNPARIERYLLLVEGSGAQAIVVLTKADRVSDAVARVAQLQARLPGARVVAVNAKDAASVAPLAAELGPGRSGVLVGSSGAGKSTLTKVIAGVVEATSGTMIHHGQEVSYKTPNEALEAGIAMVFQETSLVPSMTVAQNLYLGAEKFLNRLRGTYISAQQFLQSLNFPVDPTAMVETLGAAKKQMVEIARAVHHNAEIIIFDEPTATLTPEEKRHF